MKLESISKDHDVSLFDCGSPPLDNFLRRHALTNESNGSARTFVAIDDGRVLGFYTLTVGGVEHAEAPERIRKGLARYPIPVLLLARLGVDRSAQGQGIGKGLLRDALHRADRVSREVGIRALLIHAKDDAAKAWYQGFAEFEVHPSDPYQLLLLMKDLRKALQ